MVKCPVCDKDFNSDFALNGHIRLSRDSDRITYWKQHSKKTSQTIASESPIVFKSTGGRLIDTLESLIKNQGFINEEKSKTNKMLMEIKEIVESEREVEKEYQLLIDSEKKVLEQERQKIRNEIYQ